VTAEVVLATSNAGKLREVRDILIDLPIDLRSIADYPAFVFPQEGDDYEENAIAKARAASNFTGCFALADDSGLEVFGLGGAPGPLSARFGGAKLDDAGRVRALLSAMKNLQGDQRRARFVCVAALTSPDGDIVTAFGACEGRILETARGHSGFGYDPIFQVSGRKETMAELPAAEKNRISHRAIAFSALSDAIRVNLRLAG